MPNHNLGPPGAQRGESRTPQPGSRPQQQSDSQPATDESNSIGGTTSGKAVCSQQVAWFDYVYLWVRTMLDSVGSWPLIGTPEWALLPDDHPARWAAILDAAQHWALRLETLQQAECEASRAVSSSADWKAVAREQSQRRKAIADGCYIPRRTS
jgi:hypothetical protein